MMNKELYRILVENVKDGIYIISSKGFEFVNPGFERIVGYTAEELTSSGFDFFNLVHPDDRKMIAGRKAAREKKKDLPPLYEFRIISKEEGVRHVETNTVPLPGGKGKVLGIIRDITPRIRTEEALRESEEKYRVLVERANDGIAVIQDKLIKYINPRGADLLGYTVEELLETPFTDHVSDKDLPLLVERYMSRMAGMEVIQEYELTMKHRDGRTKHFVINAGLIHFMGRPADLVIIHDISRRKETEERLSRTLKKLRKAMGGTIQALNLTIEMRDPSTAGHQRRVADLARSIAKEIGLSPDRIDAIRMAAAIHDLGKISLPAEILSKPGRLNDVEFSLVKTHPQVGFDILKSVDFPWPIAQIVYQHHERMDGSGYPRGLKGEAILPEARIIGVADVVEAMVSHRPYRAAFRIEEALEEINGKKCSLYDQLAVDACRRLFEEKNYIFK